MIHSAWDTFSKELTYTTYTQLLDLLPSNELFSFEGRQDRTQKIEAFYKIQEYFLQNTDLRNTDQFRGRAIAMDAFLYLFRTKFIDTFASYFQYYIYHAENSYYFRLQCYLSNHEWKYFPQQIDKMISVLRTHSFWHVTRPLYKAPKYTEGLDYSHILRRLKNSNDLIGTGFKYHFNQIDNSEDVLMNLFFRFTPKK